MTEEECHYVHCPNNQKTVPYCIYAECRAEPKQIIMYAEMYAAQLKRTKAKQHMTLQEKEAIEELEGFEKEAWRVGECDG